MHELRARLLPPTRSQRYFFDQYLGTPPNGRHAFHVRCVIDLPPRTSARLAAAAVAVVVGRHDALRSTLEVDADGEVRQILHAPRPIPCPRLELADDSAETLEDAV